MGLGCIKNLWIFSTKQFPIYTWKLELFSGHRTGHGWFVLSISEEVDKKYDILVGRAAHVWWGWLVEALEVLLHFTFCVDSACTHRRFHVCWMSHSIWNSHRGGNSLNRWHGIFLKEGLWRSFKHLLCPPGVCFAMTNLGVECWCQELVSV